MGAGQGPDGIYQSANLYRSSCLFLSSFEVSCGLVHNFTPLTATIAQSLSSTDKLESSHNPEQLESVLATWKMGFDEPRVFCGVVDEDFNYNVNHRCQCQ